MKQKLFEKLQGLTEKVKGQLAMFVVSNLTIDELMAQDLGYITSSDISITNKFSLDFLIFTRISFL